MVSRRENTEGVFGWTLGTRLSLSVGAVLEVRRSWSIVADNQERLDRSIAVTTLSTNEVGVVVPIVVALNKVWTERNSTTNFTSGSPNKLQEQEANESSIMREFNCTKFDFK